jgi:predicted NAD-dependent protein-ADP-ribosyltransferase YbiA (DUF1768 family)
MELFSAEAETLRKIVGEWTEHPERELESCFGPRGQVDATRFLTVAQRLKAKGFTALPQEDRLTITTLDNTRFTLVGMGLIQQYCRDNRLAGKPFIAMIKDRAGLESNLDLDDYETRIKVRREVPLSADDARVKDILSTWGQQKKAFRLIRRWTFQGKGILFDLSIVRSTKKDLRGNYVWVRNFLDQDIISSAPIYEIEVELIRGVDTDTPEKALSSFIKGMGEVLRGLQKHTLLMRKSTSIRVLDAYKTFVNDDKFRGVAPVTLELKNMMKEQQPGVPNLRTGYNVTDKADGLRVLGFCDATGELFMIDMALNIYRTGLRKEECKNSLLDGEWVTKDKNDKAVQQLLFFDIYYGVNKKKVDELPFYSDVEGAETRYKEMTSWTKLWNDGMGPKIIISGLSAATKTQVSAKTFLFAKGDDIFKKSGQVLSRETIYNTDGLIFTPNLTPLPSRSGVGFLEQFKWKPSHDNTIDFLVLTQKDTENKREDSVITAIKPETNETIRYKTLRLYVGSSTDPAYDDPRGTILFERELPQPQGYGKGKQRGKSDYKPILFNPKEIPDTMASICYREIQQDPDTQEDFVMTERSMEPIQDRSIVEMRYDPSQPPGWRWIPIRVRYDKTERLLKGILGRTLNSDKVAESVWNSIHEPITVSMISTGSEEPSEEEMQTIAKMEEERDGVARRYYQRKAPQQDLMLVRGLRDFHNKYIKEKMLLMPVLKNGSNKTLLDVACGKAADLQKWRRGGVGFVFGIDYAGEGIRDANDGAYRRYLDTLVNARGAAVAPMVFAIGDSSKAFVNGAAGATEEEGDILRSVFGRVNPVGPVPPFVSRVGKGMMKDGADVVACMFALHYFFKDSESLAGFMTNLNDSIKIGGYFVACFFDGQRVFDLLKDKEVGEAATGVEAGAPIWSIKKNYDADELPGDEISLGMGIDVEFISIGASHTEYLVSFELLKTKMREIGCYLENPANDTALFDDSYKIATQKGNQFPMSDVVKQYSFLNRWVVFKRSNTGQVFEPKTPPFGDPPLADAIRPSESGSPPYRTAIYQAVEPLTLGPAAAATTTSVPRTSAALSAAVSAAAEAVTTTGPAAPILSAVPSIQAQPSLASAVAAASTATVEGVVPKEKTVASGPAARYESGEVFRFSPDAKLADTLKIGDKGAVRWLAPYAPFPIIDTLPSGGQVKYPTLEHYLVGMKYKIATDKPQLAASVFSEEGTIHQKFLRDRLAASGKKAITEEQDQEFLRLEMVEVRNANRASNIKKFKAQLDEATWATQKDAVLKEGLKQRWDRDARLHTIVEAARAQGKYLLYDTDSAAAGELAGVRKADGRIEGENKVGRILMQLAGYPGF